MPAGEFRGQLRLDAETIGGELQVLHALPPENFIAGFHVRQVQVAQHVGEERQEPVGQIVPEQQNPVCSPCETGAVDDVRPAVQNGFDELGIIRRIVLEISVLNQEDIAGCMFETGANRRALAAVYRVSVVFDIRCASSQLIKNFCRAVRRRVIDQNNFLRQPARVGSADSLDNCLDSIHFVENWNQDGNRVKLRGHANKYKNKIPVKQLKNPNKLRGLDRI